MGLQIEDGTGSGSQAAVKNNKLLVSGVFSTQEHYSNHNEGMAYNIAFSAVPSGPGSCFLYIKNKNPDLALSLEGIWIKMEANDYIEVKLKDTGIPVGGSDITPVNLNTASGMIALGEFQEGSDITNIEGGETVFKHFYESSPASVYRNFASDIILGSNGVLCLYIGTGTVAVEGTLVFNYHGTNN